MGRPVRDTGGRDHPLFYERNNRDVLDAGSQGLAIRRDDSDYFNTNRMVSEYGSAYPHTANTCPINSIRKVTPDAHSRPRDRIDPRSGRRGYHQSRPGVMTNWSRT